MSVIARTSPLKEANQRLERLCRPLNRGGRRTLSKQKRDGVK
jgi:hypothetical protein